MDQICGVAVRMREQGEWVSQKTGGVNCLFLLVHMNYNKGRVKEMISLSMSSLDGGTTPS